MCKEGCLKNKINKLFSAAGDLSSALDNSIDF